MYSCHVENRSGRASTGTIVRRMYTSADRTIAAIISGSVRFTGNLNSPDEWTTASKPTNAHGIIARMRRIWTAGGPSDENAGAIEASPPWCLKSAATKHVATPSTMTAASAVWMPMARRLPMRHSTPHSTMTAEQKIASPKYTSNPTIV